MARSIHRLSDRTVKTLAKPGRHADGGNLFLVVDPPRLKSGVELKGAKRWVFIFRWGGKLKEMGLGSLSAVSLADARAFAATYRTMLAETVPRNPIEVRRAEQLKQTAGRKFGELARELHAAKKGSWKSQKVTKQWLTSMERYCKPIWDKPIEAVSTEDVLSILQPIWTVKAETGSRMRGRIEAVLDAARARGLIDPDRANPARWRGHLAHLLAKRQKLQRGHHRALPYSEAAEFLTQVRQRQAEAMAAYCLEFLILTAVRTSEALHARWLEFDLNTALWVIPSERMKRSRELRIPLSDRCIQILQLLKPMNTELCSFVFPAKKPGMPLSPMAMEMLLRRMKASKITVHGMRSTFRDWAGDCTSFPRELVEEALAHHVGGEVERAYRRSDALQKRRQLMQAWADYCCTGPVDNVIPLRRASD